ncbi:MAG TPA: MgtC/SapB family protein [Gemmatimonadales bacterium]|nr:MgtC/SapB family protein [Gemmatimonadales bacterium]
MTLRAASVRGKGTRMRGRLARAVFALAVLGSSFAPLAAQLPDSVTTAASAPPGDDRNPWRDALVAVPLAAVLGAALAFRPVRRGTPPRDPAVIQTQIILAVVGSVIMLVVGASLARAFGILGAANLVRYRAKIDDPKDAAVMLVALAVGLATGVGVHAIAVGATAFILPLLWGLESFEPSPKKRFELKLTGKDIGKLKPDIERVLRDFAVSFESRTLGQEELAYDVQMPIRRRTDRVASALVAKGAEKEIELTVEWETPKKEK